MERDAAPAATGFTSTWEQERRSLRRHFRRFDVLVLIWPGFGVGWFGTSGTPADSLPESFAGQRLDYTLSQLVPLAIILVLGLIFYAAGTRTRREIRAGAHAPAPGELELSAV